MAKRVKSVITPAAITMKSAELVKEASKPNHSNGISRLISN
jgi:hypothetical protein